MKELDIGITTDRFGSSCWKWSLQ